MPLSSLTTDMSFRASINALKHRLRINGKTEENVILFRQIYFNSLLI